MNPKNAEETPVLRGIQAKYVKQCHYPHWFCWQIFCMLWRQVTQKIYVLEQPWHLSQLLDFNINQHNFDHEETCYKDMGSFFCCSLPDEDCQVWLCCNRKLWGENNSISIWLYFNQQSTLIKEIFRNLELLEFSHLKRYGWCKVNFCFTLFSVLLTHQSCNGDALLFRRRNQRNIRMVPVKL